MKKYTVILTKSGRHSPVMYSKIIDCLVGVYCLRAILLSIFCVLRGYGWLPMKEKKKICHDKQMAV